MTCYIVDTTSLADSETLESLDAVSNQPGASHDYRHRLLAAAPSVVALLDDIATEYCWEYDDEGEQDLLASVTPIGLHMYSTPTVPIKLPKSLAKQLVNSAYWRIWAADYGGDEDSRWTLEQFTEDLETLGLDSDLTQDEAKAAILTAMESLQ